MTGTPPSFAATPESRPGDVLEEMLRAVRLTGSVFLNARFTEPFGVVSPQDAEEATPLAHMRHVSVFHLIAEGSCTLELNSGEKRIVSTGDIVMMPFAENHKFYNSEVTEMPTGPDLFRPAP